jgi:hypothetical protein
VWTIHLLDHFRYTLQWQKNKSSVSRLRGMIHHFFCFIWGILKIIKKTCIRRKTLIKSWSSRRLLFGIQGSKHSMTSRKANGMSADFVSRPKNDGADAFFFEILRCFSRKPLEIYRKYFQSGLVLRKALFWSQLVAGPQFPFKLRLFWFRPIT